MQPEHIEERICQPDFATGLSVANDHRKNPGRKTAGPPDLEGSDDALPHGLDTAGADFFGYSRQRSSAVI